MKTIILIFLLAFTLNGEARTFTISNGEQLSKWVKRRGDVKFPPIMEGYNYTAKVEVITRVNREKNVLEFIGVSHPMHNAFIAELQSVHMPFVDSSQMTCDTLHYTFDFSSLLSRRDKKEMIESYEAPKYMGEEVSHEWMREVLGAENCELLYFRRVKHIRATIDIDSLGRAFPDMLYVKIPISMSDVRPTAHKWSPTEINGRQVSMSHDITFDVERLLTSEQRRDIDSKVSRADSDRTLYCSREYRIDQMPRLSEESECYAEFNKRVYLATSRGGAHRVTKGNNTSQRVSSSSDFRVSGAPTGGYFTFNAHPISDPYGRVINSNIYSIKNPIYQTAEGIDFYNYAETENKRGHATTQNPSELVVLASFAVNAYGELGDVEIIQASSQRLSTRAKELLESSKGMWSPAIHKGEYVNCKLIVNIDFRN